jgi:hypothetical protein
MRVLVGGLQPEIPGMGSSKPVSLIMAMLSFAAVGGLLRIVPDGGTGLVLPPLSP